MRSIVNNRIAFSLGLMFALAGCAAVAQDNLIDEYGRLKRMALGSGWIDIQSDIRIPSTGWKNYLTLGSAEKPGSQLTTGDQTWSSSPSQGVMSYDIEQTAHSSEGKVIFDVKVTARRSAYIEGVYFWIDIPEELFAGGSYFAGKAAGELPVEQKGQLCSVRTDRFMFFDSSANVCVAATLSEPVSVQILDQRRYNENYSAFIILHPGVLFKGDSTSLTITLEVLGDADTPAQLSMNTNDVRYKFQGFGGNYAFGIESPVTRYTLQNLRVAFARTEMSLTEWEPKEKKESSEGERINWDKFLERDQPRSRLRHEFELMQELSSRKIPYASSIWSLPGWMYTHPPKDSDATGNKLNEERWPELLECIGSYLLYAKERYHAEPDFISFNEPDIGIKVLFSSEQHRDAIKRIGAHLEKLKLKTKFLVGDCGNPRGTVTYAYPAIYDQDARKYIGAVAFHSWGGATARQYADWNNLAARFEMPLYVTEAGVDPFAWRDGKYQSFDYGLREMTHYQKLLLQAWPQTIVFWEYTEDYSLLARDPKNDGKLMLTERFCLQKQLSDLTPPGSEALATSADQGFLFTAFHHPKNAGQEQGYTLHIANPLWARKAVIQGAPPNLKLNAVQTSRGKLFEYVEPVEVKGGAIELELPAQSLTTLTTLALPKLVEP